jgi:chorismate dehydratase
MTKLDEIIANNPFASYDLKRYYTENISFKFDIEKRNGMMLFLKMLEKL